LSAATVLRLPVDAPTLSSAEWLSTLRNALAEGGRVVTLFGRSSEDDTTVTAVIERNEHDATVLRTTLPRDGGYPSLTPDFPSLHCFERELHEQTGLHVAGHPWLKPIRFEKTGPAGRNAYPFYEIKGKEVHEVAVGPIHAGVIEPGSFRFMCLGERVHHLEIQLGYQHRGVEARLLAASPDKLAPLVETIAGDTSVGHAWAYAAAIEALSGIVVPAEIDAARGIMLELERVAMHLSTLAGLATDVGFLQGASTYGRLRTTAINTSMRLCGSRFGRGAIRPGTARVQLHDDLPRNVDAVARDMGIIDDRFLSSYTVRQRLEGVGVVPLALADDLGLVGPVARASGVFRDLRRTAGVVYARHPIEMCAFSEGDCFARARVRMGEIRSSLEWLGRISETRPSIEPSRARSFSLAPRHLVVARVEGWRGEIVHALETDAEGHLVHYKVQDPSFRNWLGLALAVRENDISEFPICNKSFDLSYCGHDL
jgi:Ni,Fe-hydrogenase III large subunit